MSQEIIFIVVFLLIHTLLIYYIRKAYVETKRLNEALKEIRERYK